MDQVKLELVIAQCGTQPYKWLWANGYRPHRYRRFNSGPRKVQTIGFFNLPAESAEEFRQTVR